MYVYAYRLTALWFLHSWEVIAETSTALSSVTSLPHPLSLSLSSISVSLAAISNATFTIRTGDCSHTGVFVKVEGGKLVFLFLLT